MPDIVTPLEPHQLALDATATLAMLKHELELQRKHVRCLRDQNSALISCNRAKFEQQQKSYVALLSELEAQESRRNKLLAGRSLGDGSQEWTSQQRTALLRVCEQIGSASVQARDLNSQNRLLIEGELRYMSFMLDVMLDTARKTGHSYEAHGGLATVQRSLLINRAA